MSSTGFFHQPLDFYHGRIPFIVVDLINRLKELKAETSRDIFNDDNVGNNIDQLIQQLNVRPLKSWKNYKNIATLSIALVRYLNSITFDEPLFSNEIKDQLVQANLTLKSPNYAHVIRKNLVNLYPGNYRTILTVTDFLRNIETVSMDAMFEHFGPSFFGKNAIQRNRGQFRILFILLLIHHNEIFEGAILGPAAYLTPQQIAMLERRIENMGTSSSSEVPRNSADALHTPRGVVPSTPRSPKNLPPQKTAPQQPKRSPNRNDAPGKVKQVKIQSSSSDTSSSGKKKKQEVHERAIHIDLSNSGSNSSSNEYQPKKQQNAQYFQQTIPVQPKKPEPPQQPQQQYQPPPPQKPPQQQQQQQQYQPPPQQYQPPPPQPPQQQYQQPEQQQQYQQHPQQQQPYQPPPQQEQQYYPPQQHYQPPEQQQYRPQQPQNYQPPSQQIPKQQPQQQYQPSIQSYDEPPNQHYQPPQRKFYQTPPEKDQYQPPPHPQKQPPVQQRDISLSSDETDKSKDSDEPHEQLRDSRSIPTIQNCLIADIKPTQRHVEASVQAACLTKTAVKTIFQTETNVVMNRDVNLLDNDADVSILGTSTSFIEDAIRAIEVESEHNFDSDSSDKQRSRRTTKRRTAKLLSTSSDSS